MAFLRDACPYVTAAQEDAIHNPADMEEVPNALTIWHGMTMKWCAIVGSRSPWMAKELEWYKEGTIIRRSKSYLWT